MNENLDFDDLKEGDYVQTVEGLIFSVKGLHHPKGMIIAYLRYVPDSSGERTGFFQKYRRVYDLDETNKLLYEKFPQYMNHIKSKRLILQSVPFDKMSKIFSARRSLRNLFENPKSKLNSTTVRFVSTLSSKSGVPLEQFGISGSILLGLSTQTSDIDIIVCGIEEGRKVYNVLKKLRDSINWIKSYNSMKVREIAESRWKQSDVDIEKMVKIEEEKVLHGLVEDRDYFIRLVRKKDEGEIELSSEPIKRVLLRGRIIGAERAIFTPCEYKIKECKFLNFNENFKVTVLTSYRGKFTEQVKEGDQVEAKGMLERVIYPSKTIYRVILGRENDYLIPIHLLEK